MLTVSGCNLPCWNGITPGVTPVEDAVEILKSTEGVGADNVNIFYQSVEITFYLFLETPGIDKKVRGEIFSDGKTVKELWLYNNLGVTFGDVFQEIGEPEYVISMPFIAGGDTINVIYANVGVSIEPSQDTEVIESKTEILTLRMFNPFDYEQLLENGSLSEGGYSTEETLKIMYPWKGYGNVEELYLPRIP